MDATGLLGRFCDGLLRTNLGDPFWRKEAVRISQPTSQVAASQPPTRITALTWGLALFLKQETQK